MRTGGRWSHDMHVRLQHRWLVSGLQVPTAWHVDWPPAPAPQSQLTSASQVQTVLDGEVGHHLHEQEQVLTLLLLLQGQAAVLANIGLGVCLYETQTHHSFSIQDIIIIVVYISHHAL